MSVEKCPAGQRIWTSASFINKPTNPVWCTNGKPVDNQYWTWTDGIGPDKTSNGLMAVDLNLNNKTLMGLYATISLSSMVCEP